MTKIIAAIVVVAAIGGGIYWYTSKDKEDSDQNQNTNQTQNSQTNNNTDSSANQAQANTSLKAMATNGRPQKCTFSNVTDGVQVSGTSYLNGQGKYRVDFTSKQGTENYVGHNIFDGNATMYMWIEGQPQGFKYDLVSYETSGQAAIDPNAQVNYDCSSWNADNGMFTPPTSVSFVSFADLMREQQR